MPVVLLCSVVLVMIPIFLVQYQRFLASVPTPERYAQLLDPPSDLQVLHKCGNASFDGPASDTTSDGPSEPHPGCVAKTSGDKGRVTRKPWDPPFPMRSRTLRESYLALPRSEEERKDEHKGKGKERERRSMSQVPPEEDGFLNLGHLPVTDLPSYDAPVPHPTRSPSHVQESQAVGRSGSEARGASTQTTPNPTPATSEKRGFLSLVQTIVLVLALVIFVFAFAILVAHCMAWFVVYKTEARLGEVRKGLLRGGDMRVCLCAR